MTAGKDFWSRRKAGVAAEAEGEAKVLAEQVALTEQARLEEMPDAEILAELDLPDPDTLVEGDDFKQFLASAVPAHLRRRALRRLWLSNPLLANVDGLLDYGEDFADTGKLTGAIQTAYQAGKGMMHHVQEMERQAAAEDPEQPDDPADDVTTPETAEDARTAQAEPAAEMPACDFSEPEGPAGDDRGLAPAPRRRMRFEFESGVA